VTPEQQRDAVELLGTGSTLRETAAIVRVPWPVFAAAWREGERECNAGDETELALFYAEAQAARAQVTSSLRAQAKASAGSRESADHLALLRKLHEEADVGDVAETTAYERTGNGAILSNPVALALADELLRELAAPPGHRLPPSSLIAEKLGAGRGRDS
jgi:hypothetical protein